MRRWVGWILMATFGVAQAWAQTFPVLRWQRFISKEGDERPARMLLLPDESLLLAGTTETLQNGIPEKNLWFVKTSFDGEELWERELQVPGEQILGDLVFADDGNFFFAGTELAKGATDPGNANYLAGMLDAMGRPLWTRSYGGSQADLAHAAVCSSYREFVVAGASHSAGGDVGDHKGMSDIWLLRLDSRGGKRQSLVLGGAGQDWANAMSLCRNEDILLAGLTRSAEWVDHPATPDFGGAGLVMRLDPAGKRRWALPLPCPKGGSLVRVQEDAEGNIIVAGHQQDSEAGVQWWIAQVSASGLLKWEKSFGGDGDDYLTDIAVARDGGYLLGGYSSHASLSGYAKGGDDFWLIRINAQGSVVWKQTFGGADHERCYAVVAGTKPGVFYALGEKTDRFNPDKAPRGKDFWLLRVDELPCDSIQPDIFVRADQYKAGRNLLLRFRARHQYGEQFFWDFGDGSTSTEEQPLKSYPLAGEYPVSLSIVTNESCRLTVKLPRRLQIR